MATWSVSVQLWSNVSEYKHSMIDLQLTLIDRPLLFQPWYKWFRLPYAGLFVCVKAPNCNSRWTVSINEVLVRSPDHTASFFPSCPASVHIYLKLSDDPLRNSQYDHKSACSKDSHKFAALPWRHAGDYKWHVIWGTKLDIFSPVYLVPTFKCAFLSKFWKIM